VAWRTLSASDWLRVRFADAPEAVERRVAEIIRDVRTRGDIAVREWTAHLDHVDPIATRVSGTALQGALAGLPTPVAAALDVSARRIRAFAEAARPPRHQAGPAGDGLETRMIFEPLRRAAIYVPAGRSPLCSSVLMGVIPAQAAGVQEVALFTPPRADGVPDACTLAAAALLGIDEVYAVGGAQAIAAAAFGTESIPAADAVVGPGNRYVTEAKRQVQNRVRIDGLNGPSEVVVWGEPPAPPRQAALDLLAQAEHDPLSWGLAVSTDAEWLSEVGAWAVQLGGPLVDQVGVGAVAVESADEAVSFIQAFCPEHLELWGLAARHRDRVTAAGATFVNCPSPLGDYTAGPNHVLPTGGTARHASVLSVDTFLRRRTEVVRVGAIAQVAWAAAELAHVEGLPGHARALAAVAEEVSHHVG
jgi:histidinol dehydrogenase